jgi:hypothetical protein
MSATLLIKDGDIVLTAAGRPDTVTDATKRDLDIANALLTPLDLNRQTGPFGNEFLLSLDGGGSPVLPNERLIATSVSEAIERLQALQRKDQYLTAAEEIVAVDELVVKPLRGEQTAYVFFLRLRSRAGSAEVARKLSFGHHNIPEKVRR